MDVELKFEEPFYGVAYADFDRNSACMVKGRGLTNAKLELPLKGKYLDRASLLGNVRSNEDMFISQDVVPDKIRNVCSPTI